MKTVNLELSKQLKEAGYPQDGYWYWTEAYPYESHVPALWRFDVVAKHNNKYLSPTADEILDELLEELAIDKSGEKGFDKWQVECGDWAESDNDLSNAAAKMWLYLKKEGLL